MIERIDNANFPQQPLSASAAYDRHLEAGQQQSPPPFVNSPSSEKSSAAAAYGLELLKEAIKITREDRLWRLPDIKKWTGSLKDLKELHSALNDLVIYLNKEHNINGKFVGSAQYWEKYRPLASLFNRTQEFIWAYPSLLARAATNPYFVITAVVVSTYVQHKAQQYVLERSDKETREAILKGVLGGPYN